MPNRAVFITGAAAGIGRATALTFATKGYTVGGYDIDEVGLKSLADEIDDLGGTAITGHLDVTDSTEMAQRVGEFAEAAGGRLDVMINNAGILLAGHFEDIDVVTADGVAALRKGQCGRATDSRGGPGDEHGSGDGHRP